MAALLVRQRADSKVLRTVDSMAAQLGLVTVEMSVLWMAWTKADRKVAVRVVWMEQKWACSKAEQWDCWRVVQMAVKRVA